MNTPRVSFRMAALLAVGFVISACALHARVGETQAALEKRIFQPGLGKLYPKVSESSKDKDRPRKKEDDPLKDMRGFIPSDTREMLYWKSAIANQLSNETGWKIDVFYLGGVSVLEAYKRVGDALSEFEVRGILNLNRGASSWKKNSVEGGKVNGIGYDYELEDGSLRAKQQDSWLIIFSSKLDAYVIQQQLAARDARDAQREQQKREQALKAPESIAGF